jgi:hypothetical protein
MRGGGGLALRTCKQYFDEDIRDDVRAVLDISALLGISEFRLFHLAYRFWYGDDAAEETIERYFIPYMFHDAVPPWVRHFTNHVTSRAGEGRLDPAEYGIARRFATNADIRRGRAFALGLVTAMVMLVLLAELAGEQYCLFPPCY